ncbi:hypothetical protein HDU99_003889, partial [Rhizoclosmatium hyalinum]
MLGKSTSNVELIAQSPTSNNEFMNALRTNDDFADILLLIGESKTPIWAHANILAQSCDFYKTALAARWNASESTAQLPSTINKDNFIRSIISHPDVGVDTFNIILEFLYCGKVTIPSDLLTSAAMFSNQLMVKALRDQSLDYCLNIGLSVDNAFEIFVLGERLCRSDVRVNALIKVMDDLPKSVQCGCDILADMDTESIELVLTFEPFTAVQRWRIAI